MMETLEKEMNLLLQNFWITKDAQREDYYFLKKNQNRIKDFVGKNLGNKLLVHDRFIKLEKIPASASEELGITFFLDSLDYIILFLFLLYLEDKTKGEKFILSSLTSYIKNTAITLELKHIPDWNYAHHRKSLIRVLSYLEDTHVITLKDTDNRSFQDTMEADALYEATGLANYLLPSFDYDIYDCKKAEDFLKKEWADQTEEKGDVRRFKVYRHLLYTPAISRHDATDSEDDYLKKMHKIIQKELNENLSMDVEITKNLSLVYLPDTIVCKEYFPNMKKLSDVILLINKRLISFKEKQDLPLDDYECFHLSKQDFERILKITREEEKAYFSKYYLDLSFQKYVEEVLDYMKKFHFLKEEEDHLLILPTVYRYLGKTEIKKENEEQLNIMEVLENEV